MPVPLGVELDPDDGRLLAGRFPVELEDALALDLALRDREARAQPTLERLGLREARHTSAGASA